MPLLLIMGNLFSVFLRNYISVLTIWRSNGPNQDYEGRILADGWFGSPKSDRWCNQSYR